MAAGEVVSIVLVLHLVDPESTTDPDVFTNW